MAQTITINPANTSSATFRAWGSAVSAAIGTNGQVQTADTGQINWTTVAVPAQNVAAGYEIWRFADTLQSTAPVFMKIEYGCASASLTPQIWLTVGTGSDGAGTITGAVSGVLTPQIAPRTAMGPASGAATAVGTTSYVNGTTGCLAMFLFPNNNPTGWCGFAIVVERTKDGAGADTGDGVMILGACAGVSGLAMACPLTYLPGVRLPQTALAITTTWPVITAPFGATVQTMVASGVLYPAQVFTGTGPKGGGPSQYVTAVMIGDIAAGQTVAVTHYGTSRNWYTAGIGNNTGSSGWGGIGGSSDVNLLKSFLFRIN